VCAPQNPASVVSRPLPSRVFWPGYFLTKIFHPNISKTGEICVNTLKKDWRADLGIGHVLQVVRCLLINPFPESALNEEAGKLCMEEYESYFRKAQMMTEVHAVAKKVEVSGAVCGEGSLGEPVEKRQKQPVDADKVAEKRRQEKKKSLKRYAAPGRTVHTTWLTRCFFSLAPRRL